MLPHMNQMYLCYIPNYVIVKCSTNTAFLMKKENPIFSTGKYLHIPDILNNLALMCILISDSSLVNLGFVVSNIYYYIQ